jgi:general secretion pathway protein D
MNLMRRLLAGAALAAALGAGCTTTVVPAPPPKAEISVTTNEDTRAVDDVAARRLKLEARFREGMEHFNAGRIDVAAAILQEVSRQIDEEGVQLSPVSHSKMKAVLAGTYKPPRKETKPVVLPAREYGPATPAVPKPEPAPAPAPEAPRPAPEPVGHLPALADPATADQLITVDFNQVDIRIFIKTISELTGFNFLLDDNVRGTVTLISPTKVRVGEVYKVLENVLDVKGFAAVPSGSVIKIVPRAEATRKTPVTRVGNDPAAMPREDTVVTQIIPLRYAAAADIVGLVSPLIAAGDQLTPYAQTNALVVTGSSANIRRMAEIIRSVDVPAAQEEVSVIPLKHANSTEVAQQIQAILEKDATASRASETPTPRGVATAAAAAALSAKSSFKIIPDTRTNSLVVLANSRMMQSIRDLVAQLDVQRAIDAGNIHVVYLENAEAKDVAKSLSAALEASAKAGGQKADVVKVTADESTNSLIIIASPEDFRVTADIIAKLDIVREQVLVEVKIMECDQDVLRDIGVDWATLDQASSDGLRGFSGTNLGVRTEAMSGTMDGLGVGAFKLVNGTTQIAGVLKMFEKNSKVNILSTPQILTSNHREAQITVAENIPYVKESRVSEVEPSAPTVIKTYDYRDVGVIVKLTPHISQGGAVRLVMDMTFSKQLPSANADTPTTAKRQAQTVVTVQNGATIVIGGLIRDDNQNVVKKVPFFGDIPYLGFFFQRKETQVTKTNLFIFITPHVLTGKSPREEAPVADISPPVEKTPPPDAAPQ